MTKMADCPYFNALSCLNSEQVCVIRYSYVRWGYQSCFAFGRTGFDIWERFDWPAWSVISSLEWTGHHVDEQLVSDDRDQLCLHQKPDSHGCCSTVVCAERSWSSHASFGHLHSNSKHLRQLNCSLIDYKLVPDWSKVPDLPFCQVSFLSKGLINFESFGNCSSLILQLKDYCSLFVAVTELSHTILSNDCDHARSGFAPTIDDLREDCPPSCSTSHSSDSCYFCGIG